MEKIDTAELRTTNFRLRFSFWVNLDVAPLKSNGHTSLAKTSCMHAHTQLRQLAAVSPWFGQTTDMWDRQHRHNQFNTLKIDITVTVVPPDSLGDLDGGNPF